MPRPSGLSLRSERKSGASVIGGRTYATIFKGCQAFCENFPDSVLVPSGTISCTNERTEPMAMTASEARKNLFPLIEQVNNDRRPIEITSKHGDAVLMS